MASGRHPIPHAWMPIVGALLFLAGVLGIAAVAVLGPALSPGVTSQRGGGGTSASNADLGAQIYTAGVGHAGPIAGVWEPPGGRGMMGRRGRGSFSMMSCVGCHRPDGRGGTIGMMGFAIDAPDIRYATLSQPHTDETETVPGWTDTQIATAIRDGVEPDGKALDPLMPRWDMDETDMQALLAYLKELK